MTPERSAANPKFNLRKLYTSRNGSRSLTPNGEIVMQLALIEMQLDPATGLAMSPEYRATQEARRTELERRLQITSPGWGFLQGVVKQLKQRTGVSLSQTGLYARP